LRRMREGAEHLKETTYFPESGRMTIP
jgi:hypothetical protein